MSTANQTNGKKNNSTNNSMTNTPSSTPVSTIVNPPNSQAPAQSSTPPNNAPKYGTLVPNRIFVGGISASTTEAELLQLFSNYGTVKAAKIIQDRAGVSKGYGFITFESEEEAKRLQREADNIVLKERKLNIAPAIKKQPFSRAFDASSPPAIAPGAPAQYYIPAGSVPFYQGGVTYYPQPGQPGDPNTQQPPVYQPPAAVYPPQSGPPHTAAYPSLVYPSQPLYMPQQFPYQPVPYEYNYYPNGGPQYVVGNQGTPQPQAPPMQPPGSPPRTPCYNPYPNETLYFNMSMYGGPMETAVYQDMDMANGNLTEDFSYMGAVSHDLEPPLPPPDNVRSTPELTNPTSIDTTRQSNTPVVSLLSLDQRQEKDITAMKSGRRQKSVDQPPPANNAHHFGPNGFVPPPSFSSAGNPRSNYLNVSTNDMSNSHNGRPHMGVNLSSTFSFNGCLPFAPPSEFYSSKFSHASLKTAPNFNSIDKSAWQNKRRSRTNDRRNSEGYSNPRTESNSSASVVDENRNEEKSFRTNTNTPPPAPYSPILQYNRYGSRNFHASSRPVRGGYYNYNNNNNTRSHSSYVSNPSKWVPPARKPTVRSFSKSNQSNAASKAEEYKNLGSNASYKIIESSNTTVYKSETVAVSNTPSNKEAPTESAGNLASEPCNDPITNCSLSLQIPPGGPQNFVPPARRTNRRSVRRNTHAGPSLSEIGAGDAPLPSAEVADTCKKLDNLKL